MFESEKQGFVITRAILSSMYAKLSCFSSLLLKCDEKTFDPKLESFLTYILVESTLYNGTMNNVTNIYLVVIILDIKPYLHSAGGCKSSELIFVKTN